MESAKDELAGLRELLVSLKSGLMEIRENSKNVTKREIDKLEVDIKYLESALKRVK